MIKKKKEIAIIIAFFISMVVFAIYYTEMNRVATQEMRYLYFSILTTFFVIFIHFFKKIRRIRTNKDLEILFDSVELLLIVASPIALSFELLTKWYPNNPDYQLVTATAAIFSWFIVTMYRTNRVGDKTEGKMTETLTGILYAGFLFVLGLGVWFLIVF